MDSLRRECLDYMLILSEQHPRRIVNEYIIYFSQAKPHQGIHQRIPLTFDLLGPPPLTITTMSPDPDSHAVDVDAAIVIGFDRPIVPLDSVSAPSEDSGITPFALLHNQQLVAGTGEWLTTSLYSFTPEEELSGDTDYTVTVYADLTALDGTTLDAPCSWTFVTAAPNVLSVESTREMNGILQPDSDVRVQFSQAMAHAPTEAVAESFGFRGNVWTQPRVAQVIKRAFGVSTTPPLWGAFSNARKSERERVFGYYGQREEQKTKE